MNTASNSEHIQPDSIDKKILRYKKAANRATERIDKLVSSRWFATDDALALNLSDELKNENIHTVGVVNENGKVTGIIVRQHLMNLLSRQFGREVLKTEKIREIQSTCRHFHADVNIFTVADSIGHEMQSEEITYFLVKDYEGNFTGVFSTHDMLQYLSSMTRRDIELARVIQKGIVKEFQYHIDKRFEIVCSSIMAQIVGGDFYTLQKLTEDKYFFILCDVSGKGVAASLVTAFLYGMTHNYKFYPGLTEFVTDLNRLFIQTFNLEKFVTGQFIAFDQNLGTMTVCEMGHPFAYVFRHGQLKALDEESQNLPIGVSAEIVIRPVTYNLQTGDIVLIVTDGITEQTNHNDELLSLDDLAVEIEKYKDLPLNRISVRILEFFHSFRQTTPLQDDVTFLLLRYKG